MSKACNHFVDIANLRMVSGCTQAGLAHHALYMYVHRLTPSDGHLILPDNTTPLFEDVVKNGGSNCVYVIYTKECQMCTLEHALPNIRTTPSCEHSWRTFLKDATAIRRNSLLWGAAAKLFQKLMERCQQLASRRLTDVCY